MNYQQHCLAHHFAHNSRPPWCAEFGGSSETKSEHALSNELPFGNFHRQKLGCFVCTKFLNGMFLRRQKLIGGFKVKSPQSNQRKWNQSKTKCISRITRDPLDVPSSEESRRLSQSQRYRMSYLSGTFTVKSWGVSCAQNLKRAHF